MSFLHFNWGFIAVSEVFNAIEEAIKFKQQKTRAGIYKRSRLEKFDTEIRGLKEAGLNFSDITKWLRQNKRTKVHRTTVARWYYKHYG